MMIKAQPCNDQDDQLLIYLNNAKTYSVLTESLILVSQGLEAGA